MSGSRFSLRGVIAFGALCCFSVPQVVAAEDEFPPVADLIGRWESTTSEANWLELDKDDSGMLVATGPNWSDGGKPPWTWNIDPYIPYRIGGAVNLRRYPTVDEMEKKDAPEWARREVVDKLLWEQRLLARKGKEGLVSGDRCDLTLSGNFFPGKVNVTGTQRDPITNDVLEKGGKVEIVLFGPEADAQKRPLSYKRKWYDPPKLDNSVTFRWTDPGSARAKLGYASADATIAEINSAVVDATAYGYYRKFIGAIFKAGTYAISAVGVGGAVEIGAESLLGQVAQNTVENVIGKAIEGDPIGREILVEAIASTAASALVGRLISADAFFDEALSGDLAEEVGESLVGPLTDRIKVKSQTTGEQLGKTQLTNEEIRGWLEEQFTKQCRFQMLPVKLARDIAGILVADRGKHTAEIVLYVPRNGNPSAVVRGSFGYITSEGLPPPNQSIFLNVLGK